MSLDHAKDQLARATLDHCVKCTICETQCPVAAVTPLFPGPKYVGPQAERFRDGESVDHSLDYCSSCGICTHVCPQGVHIAELNAQARAVMKADRMPVRDRLISDTMLQGTAMSPLAPIANVVLGSKPARVAIEKVIGIHRDAPMPTARSRTLDGWLKRKPPRTTPATRGPLVYFHGCAAEFYEQETAIKTIEVLELLGYDVVVPKQGCCGLPNQSNGLFAKATGQVTKLARDLGKGPADVPIIATSTSCGGMLKHEAEEIMGVHDADLEAVAPRVRDICEFLLELHEAGELPPFAHGLDVRVPYHPPCQLKGHGMGTPALDVMELIPGVTVVESGVQCCGMAGTYGIKKEKYDIAIKVGQPLFDMVRETTRDVPEADRLAVCDSETCRWQIEKASEVRTVHPIHLVHAAYGLSEL